MTTAPTRTPRLLVVDDEPALRAALGRALTPEGYELAVASDGRGALAHLAEHEVDLVLVDVAIP
ncbi:MAG TPA: response regulator, partial [Solirubrobacteraceae bacterium]